MGLTVFILVFALVLLGVVVLVARSEGRYQRRRLDAIQRRIDRIEQRKREQKDPQNNS